MRSRKFSSNLAGFILHHAHSLDHFVSPNLDEKCNLDLTFMWAQRRFSLPPQQRGCHLVTEIITKCIPEISQYSVGICHLFLQHSSASLTLNENYDPDVREDMEMMLNRIAPENAPYQHTMEGSDDMPAHVKCTLIGSQLSIPITNGRLALGTWQGIWLCEHRDRPTARHIVATINGQPVNKD